MHRPLFHKVPSRPAAASLGQRAVDAINAQRRKETIVAVIANGKGGSGKTTLTTNVAVAYGWQCKRVLVIDADVEQQSVVKWPRPPI